MEEKWADLIDEKYRDRDTANEAKIITRALARCMYTIGYDYKMSRALLDVDAETGQEIKEYVKLAYAEMGGRNNRKRYWE